MVEVHLAETDKIELALKTFKRKLQRAGILKDLKRRRHYVAPSEARRIKSKNARRRRETK